MNQLEIIIKARDEFSKTLADLDRRTKDFDKTLGQVGFASAGASAGAYAAGLLALGGGLLALGKYLESASAKSIVFTGTLADLASKAGRSTTFMQEVGAAGKLVGVSLETTTMSLAKFNAKLGDGDSKTFVEGLAKINLSVAQLKGMSPEDQFNKIAASIRGVASEAERADITKKLFGSLSILPLITSDFEKAAEQAHKLGNVMSVEMVAAGDLLGDRVQVLSGTWEQFNLQVGGLVNQNASVHAFVTGLTDMLAELKAKVFENTGEFQRFVSNGVAIAVDGMGLFIKAGALAWSTFESLIIISKAAEIAFIALGRAFLELDRMRSYLVIGGAELRKNLDAQIEGAALLQKALREEQEEIKRTRDERGKGVDAILVQLQTLKGKISSVAGQSVLIGDAMKQAGQAGGDALAAGFGKAEKAAEKALQKFKESWSYANLPKGFVGPPNPYNSTWDGTGNKRGFGIDLPGDEFSTSSNNLGVVGHGVMSNAQIVAMYEAAKATKTVEKASVDWSKALADVSNAFQALGLNSSNVLVSITAQLAGAFAAAQRVKSIMTDKDGKRVKWGDLDGGQKAGVGVAGLQAATSAYASGSFLGGAAGGAAFGSAFGAPGAIIGGAVGGILGIFGGKAKAKAELTELRKELEGMRTTAQKLGIDLTSAFSSKNPAALKAAIDGVKASQAEFEKQVAGAHTAAGGLNLYSEGLKKQFATIIPEGLKDYYDKVDKDIQKFLKEHAGKVLSKAEQDQLDYMQHNRNVTGKKLENGDPQNAETQARFDRLGLYAGATFGALLKDGDTISALNEIGPTLDMMAEQAEKFGFKLSASVENLIGMRNAIGGDSGLGEQISGLNQMMKGLGDSGYMNKEIFAAFGADASAIFAELTAGSASSDQALALMQPTLQALYVAQKKHGYAVDETTQALIDEAKAQGIVGDQFMTSSEQMVDLMKVLILAVGGELPDAYKRAGNAAVDYGRTARNNMPPPPPGPGGGYHDTTGKDPVENPGDSFASGTAFRNFGTGTKVTLHGEEAVMTRGQVDRLVGMAISGEGGGRGGGGGAPVITFGDITIHASDEAGGRAAAKAFIVAIKNNVEGIRDVARAYIR